VQQIWFLFHQICLRIEVIKAITPDMDAKYGWRCSYLKLASAQPGLHFYVMAQGNYNSSDRTTDTYKMWGVISGPFL